MVLSVIPARAGGEEDSEIKSSWLFSRLVDLNELSSITVDGVTYSLPITIKTARCST